MNATALCRRKHLKYAVLRGRVWRERERGRCRGFSLDTSQARIMIMPRCVVYWYPFSNPHTLWPSIATRPAIFTICHVFLKYLYTNKTHSLIRHSHPSIPSIPSNLYAISCSPGRPLCAFGARILGHERPGWCYPTGRCAYLPSLIRYRQSINCRCLCLSVSLSLCLSVSLSLRGFTA